MVKTQKETVTKRYKDDSIYEETIIQFHYDTETEKLEHSREMQKNGFEDSGQVRENVGDMLHPEYVWFGSYYKHIKVEENVLPDMREKVKEYMSELDTEIDRCTKFIEDKLSKIKDNDKKEIYLFSIEYITLKTRVNTLTEVKNDLQGRLEKLI